MKIRSIITFIIISTVFSACSSDSEPYGEKNAENSFLNTTTNNIVFDDERSKTVHIETSEGLSWSVMTSDYWINVDKQQAKGPDFITISVTEDNPETTSRKGTVTLQSNRYHLTKTINVEQDGTFLNIDNKTEYFPNAGGSLMINVESNASWYVWNKANWISTSVEKGTRGKYSFNITAQANLKDTERRATIKIITENQATFEAIEIIQSPVELYINDNDIKFKPEGGQYELSITSNSTWTISSNASWCTVNPGSGKENGKVILTASNNMGTSNRSATITAQSGSIKRLVNITQSYATLTVDQSPINIGPEEFTKSIVVSSNTNWTATSSETWCTVTQSNEQLTIKAAKNNTNNERTATITIKALGVTKTIKVTQKRAILELSASELSFGPEGGTESVKIESNVSWTASSDASWCTLSIGSGTGVKNITIKVSENMGSSNRSAKITIKTDFNTKVITIKQENTSLTITKASIVFGPDQASEAFTISTNTKWSIDYSNASWLDIKPTSGTGNSTITVTAETNKSSQSREKDIIVKAGNVSKTIKISQKGVTLSIDPISLSFNVKGGTQTISVTSNTTVNATSNMSWCTASLSGNTVSVKVTENKSNAREGTVTITAGSISKSVKINQEGVTLSVNTASLSFDIAGGTKTISVTSNTSVSANSNASWCTATVSGSTISVKTTANTSSQRECTVTVRAGDLSKSIKISQEGVSLTLNTNSLYFDVAGGTKTVTASSNTAVSATSSAYWCTASVSGKTISIKTTANTSTQRECTVNVRAGDLSKSIKITQEGVSLSVTPNSLSFGVDGGTKTLTATSNTSFTATSNVSWCTVSISGNTISVKTTANKSNTREGNVTIQAGEISKIITILQEGVTLSVTPKELSFNSAGGTKTITASSNVSISATSNASWCTVNVSGSTITVKASANKAIGTRTAAITVKAGDISRTVNVTQSGDNSINIDDYPDDTNLN